MARQSLKASPEGIATLKATLKRKRWAQTFLAGAAGCSRQTIWSLCHGNPIDAEVFLAVCTQLGLSVHEIAQAGQAEEGAGEVLEIDELVRRVRAQIQPWMHERCGTMNVLSMTKPIGLGDIYTDVNILEKITGRKRSELKDLASICHLEDFERFGFSDLRKVERVPGLDAVERCRKMVVLGKPGAGKTTFLKRVSTQCNMGTFHPGLVPIFVTLKQFAEAKGHPDLLAYIAKQWAEYKVQNPEEAVETLLYGARALVLLDGLDEVAKADNHRVIEDIRQFSERFYGNFFVLTCRIAAQEFKLEPFIEVEIADFDDQQIAIFVTKWFELKNPERTEPFLRKLKDSPRIRELATNPLLLTLLCLGFEDAGYFSDSRARLYKKALTVLLETWDGKRSIERDVVYKQLIPDRKEDLLSQLAHTTFEQGQYFFNEEIAKHHISAYIANLPGAETEAEKLCVDSKAVLKAIERQHGLLVERSQEIYSFSHLTFQEYFTARKVVASCNPFAADDKTLQGLLNRVTEKRWREIFLLVAEMLPSADCLLLGMKRQIDTLIAQDETLQKFLGWAHQKAESVNASYKSAAVRSLYMYCTPVFSIHDYVDAFARLHDPALDHSLNLFLDLVLPQALKLELDLDLDLFLDLLLTHILNHFFYHSYAPDYNLILDLSHALDMTMTLNLVPEFHQNLQRIKSQLPNPNQDIAALREWGTMKGQAWAEELRSAMIEYRSIWHNWPFTSTQIELLKRYFNANLLLVNCLNSKGAYVSREVRQSIEDTLLLPISLRSAS